MKRYIAVALCAAVAFVPGSAGGAKKQQRVEGSVLLPAPFAADTSGCYGGLHRRIYTITGEPSNEVFGYAFDVDKATWNKNFVLELNDSTQPADLDLFMYSHFPTVDEWPNDPVNAGTPVSVDFNTRAVGGESGKVPLNTIKAIVCMYGGEQGDTGLNASFTYTAGKGVKLPKD